LAEAGAHILDGQPLKLLAVALLGVLGAIIVAIAGAVAALSKKNDITNIEDPTAEFRKELEGD